jgi:hypothetical protein
MKKRKLLRKLLASVDIFLKIRVLSGKEQKNAALEPKYSIKCIKESGEFINPNPH